MKSENRNHLLEMRADLLKKLAAVDTLLEGEEILVTQPLVGRAPQAPRAIALARHEPVVATPNVQSAPRITQIAAVKEAALGQRKELFTTRDLLGFIQAAHPEMKLSTKGISSPVADLVKQKFLDVALKGDGNLPNQYRLGPTAMTERRDIWK